MNLAEWAEKNGIARVTAYRWFRDGKLHPDVSVRGLEDLLTAVLAGLARSSTHAGDSNRHAAAVAVLQRCLAGTVLA